MQKRKRSSDFNKKGLVPQIITIFILMGVFAGVILIYFVWSLTAPPLVSTFDTLTTNLLSIGEGDGNLTFAINKSFVPINNALPNLKWIGYSVFIAMLMGFFIVALFVRSYPFLMIFWLMFMIVMAFTSIYLGSVYQDIANSDPTYTAFSANHFLLNYLPHITIVFGFIGGIILFILAHRNAEEEILV